MPDRPLIVNATAIGHSVDGIAVYAVNLVKALWLAGAGRPTSVVLNEDARRFFPESEIPAGAEIRWVTARMSPSRGTRGNLLRWLFANHLAQEYRDATVFGLSQLEAPVLGGRGVVTVHDMIPWLFRSAHPRQYHFYRHCLGKAINHAHAVVTPSQTTKDDLCRYYGISPDRVHVIRHGSPVPAAAVRAAGKPPDQYILWIGRADPTKNVRAVLEAFQTIARECDVRLVLAGEGSPVALGTTGLGDQLLGRVTVLGPVTESQKIALLDGASALVCPSLYEGFGFVPLEAMARGCPVVAAGTGALPEVCGDAVIYTDPRQPRLMADALLRVLTRPDLARTLIERGRARALAFTWGASVRAHVAVFDHVARLSTKPRSTPGRRRESRVEPGLIS